VSLADVGSLGGGRAWDGIPATTAASMLWEDMMEVRSGVACTAGLAVVVLIGMPVTIAASAYGICRCKAMHVLLPVTN
jgi:hypothetical protein